MNNITSTTRRDYILSGLALFAGLYIYAVYRTEKIVVNQIVEFLARSFYQSVVEYRRAKVLLPDWMVYSLPEGLWVFSVTILSGGISLKLFKKRISFIFIPILYALLLELMQLFQITNGRFDVVDIGVSIGFWLMAIVYKYRVDGTLAVADNRLNKSAILLTYALLYLSDVFISG